MRGTKARQLRRLVQPSDRGRELYRGKTGGLVADWARQVYQLGKKSARGASGPRGVVNALAVAMAGPRRPEKPTGRAVGLRKVRFGRFFVREAERKRKAAQAELEAKLAQEGGQG